MTTIASDGITVSADSLSNCDGFREPKPEKKLVLKGGYLFGICGDIGVLPYMVDWYLAGKKIVDYPKPGVSFAFIVFLPQHALAYNEDGPYPSMRDYPVTFGSGGQIARGTMLHGATPYEAVRAACRVDTRSQEPITTHTIPPLPKQKRATKTGRTRRSK